MKSNFQKQFEQVGQEVICVLMLADITGYTNITTLHSNRTVTDFLKKFHERMQKICDEHNAVCDHESGDSFWVFVRDEDASLALGRSLIQGYKDFLQDYAFSEVMFKSKIRMVYAQTSVLGYEVNGELHYNSAMHTPLYEQIETMSREEDRVIPLQQGDDPAP